MMGTRRARRGESESIGVFFDTSRRVVRGNRNAFTTGVPTHLSDDRNGLPLQATDTAAALALARTLRIRCGE